MLPVPMPLLGGHFDAIPDPRREQGRRHTLADLFALTLCAVVSGADDVVAVEAFGRAQIDWLRRFIPLAEGVPSHDTLSRVFALVDRAHFERSFAAWAAEALTRTDGQVVAVDGKRLRRARDAGQPMMTVVSAWASESGTALGQVATHDGEGEVSAIPRLLALLDLSGCIVTLDAAGCQTDIAKQIVDGGGDYVLAVKGNQGSLRQDGYLRQDCERWLFEATVSGTVDAFETVERGHGRDEMRRYWSAPVPDGTVRTYVWAGLTSVGMVEATRTIDGKTSVEQRYFATSLPVDESAGRRRDARAVRAGSLGRRERAALDARRGVSRGREPVARGSRRGEPVGGAPGGRDAGQGRAERQRGRADAADAVGVGQPVPRARATAGLMRLPWPNPRLQADREG